MEDQKMKYFFLAGTLALAPIPAFAEIDLDAAAARVAKVDFTTSGKQAFLEETQWLHEVVSPAAFVIFTRIDPSLEEYVPDFSWNDAYEEAHGCIFDGLNAKGALEEANLLAENSIKSLALIQKNTDLTFATLGEYPEYLELMVPQSNYVQLAQDCNLMSLNADASTESGIWDAIKAISEKSQ